MNSTPTAAATPAAATGPHRAELRGRATGTGVMACFALGWTAAGVSPMPLTAGRVLFAVAVVITAAFAVLAARMSRRAALAPTGGEPSTERKRTVGRRFALVFGAEVIAIVAIAWILGTTGHSQTIAALTAAAVGIHFFPLARLFGVRAYHVTGAALCVFAAAAALLAPLTSTPALWTLLPGFGSALTLYATSAHLLRTESPA